MPLPTIIIDQHRLLPLQDGVLAVANIGDYVPACIALRRALREQTTPLEIRVHDPTVASWLSSLAESYGEHRIVLRRYTAQQALKERWNIQVPASLLDRDILQSRLLDEQITAREGQSLDDALLEHFYSDVLTYPTFPAEQLAPLLNAYNPDEWKSNERRPLVVRAYHARLDQWQRRETSESRRQLITQLRQAPSELRNRFAAYKILRSYPETLAEKVLSEDAGLFRRAKVDSEQLSVSGIDLNATETAIGYYLESVRSNISNAADVVTLLDLVSGHLLIEFNAIERIIRDHADWITPDLLRRIEQRFRPIRDGIGTRLASMRQLIAPVRPGQPDTAWSVEEWLSWVRDAYMPYYRWLDARRQIDETVAGYAETFANWYYNHFIELKNASAQHFAFNALYQERERIKDSGVVSLIVLLDNFNYLHFNELRRMFNQHDYAMLDDRPMFSLIPTATEISKAGIVAGFGDQTDIQKPQYASLIAQEWGRILQPAHKTVAYLANLGELQSLAERAHDLYFLNYLPVDKALHDDAKETGQDHTTVVLGHLQQLVTSIVEFSRRFQIERRLIVYVISDHGSTRIGQEVINVLDQEFYKGLALDKHHRYIPISDKKFAELPQMVEQQCYVVDKGRFKTNEHYLAARGYYRFLKTTEDFYVHGGLTPEEVVVPFARFELKPLSVTAPTLHLSSTQFRYAVRSFVEIEIGNPNVYSLENIGVKLRGVDSEEQGIDILGSKQTQVVRLPTVFKKEPGTSNTREIVVRVRYECQGREFEPVDVAFTVTMKSMMEAKSDFDL